MRPGQRQLGKVNIQSVRQPARPLRPILSATRLPVVCLCSRPHLWKSAFFFSHFLVQ